MKHCASLPFASLVWFAALTASAPAQSATESSQPIPVSELGAKAGAQYHGDGLSLSPTQRGARLRCVFQKLEGHVTDDGLWLTSTVVQRTNERFRVVACALGRGSSLTALRRQGTVTVVDKLARYVRPELTEEYSVSVDGVRQDFVIAGRPAGAGDLRVELELTGARAEAASYGAKLTLGGTQRELAYSRLHVLDATGRELAATLEVLSAHRLAVRVADATANYPVRIDPTFSDADWVSLNPGIPGAENIVYAAAVDGTGNLYIGGAFTVVGTVKASRIAKWDGSTWSALGSGVSGSWVFTLAVSGTDLFVGGQFGAAGGVTAKNIAKWNGSTWSALGAGLDGAVRSLIVGDTNLYTGGDFTFSPGYFRPDFTFVPAVSANYIAKWSLSTSNWSALGSGMNNVVNALAASGADLYAGGRFTMAGTSNVNYIAKWNGSNWSALGSGMTSWVYALAVNDTNVYAGGDFPFAGGVMVNGLARWDGSTWSALGSGMISGSTVNALAVSGTDLYAGGSFTTAGGLTVNRVAKWDGSTWSAIGTGIPNSSDGTSTVYALALSGGDLFAGGDFRTTGALGAKHIAKWNGSAWTALGSGIDSTVAALAVNNTDLYVGGYFNTAGGGTASRIAKWNGSAWSALGSGISTNNNSVVRALAVSDTNLYVGGLFTSAGGSPATNIAKWDGSTWSPLGDGVAGGVRALAVIGTDLYAGGDFTTAGGVSALNIAKWNDTSWSALGEGITGPVLALAAIGTNLYVGGNFRFTGGVAGLTVNHVAKWDGTAWSDLAGGMNQFGTVSALAVIDTDLYAGGDFTTAGGISALRIAKWNGSGWSALGSGIDSTVFALAVSDTNLYVGGRFTTAGGVTVNRIAKWNGSVWSAFGSGILGNTGGDFDGSFEHNVNALAADASGHLFVGGIFGFAGTNLSPYIAQANIGSAPPSAPVLNIRLTAPDTAQVYWPSPSTGFDLQANTNLATTDWFTPAEAVQDNGTIKYIIINPPTESRFFRLFKP